MRGINLNNTVILSRQAFLRKAGLDSKTGRRHPELAAGRTRYELINKGGKLFLSVRHGVSAAKAKYKRRL